jgi:hypothetical protein
MYEVATTGSYPPVPLHSPPFPNPEQNFKILSEMYLMEVAKIVVSWLNCGETSTVFVWLSVIITRSVLHIVTLAQYTVRRSVVF